MVLDFVDSDGGSTPSASLDMRYLHGAAVDQLLAQETTSSAVRWMLADHQGTIRDVSDNTGDTTGRHVVFDAFGNVTSGTLTSRFSYTGQEYDPDTGLYYYNARWYNPSVGRFISKDPIGFAGGDTNQYAYVGNGATNYGDPGGKMPNQQDAMTIDEFIEYVKQIEESHPDESPAQHLVRLRDAIKGGTRGSCSGGSGSNRSAASTPSGSGKSSATGSPPNDPNGNVPWGYIYTEEKGWIDVAHFTEAARYSKSIGSGATEAGGYLVEVQQGMMPGTRGGGSSSFTPEDLPSNGAGAAFGCEFNQDEKLSDQLRKYFNKLGAKKPTDAPDYNDLPANEDEWEEQWKANHEREQKERIRLQNRANYDVLRGMAGGLGGPNPF